MTPHALTRPPTRDLADGERTFVNREPIDFRRAAAEHLAYCEALERAGCTVERLPPLPGAPDACFVEDAALVLQEVALVFRMGSERRRVETASVAEALARHLPVEVLAAPAGATLDGGDVLAAEGTLYVGLSRRTNHAALKALAHAVLPHGHAVKAVEVEGALHLKTAASYLGRGRLLVAPDHLNLERVRDLELVAVPPEEPFGANVLRVGERLLVPRAHPRTADLLADLDHEVELVKLDELSRAEAGPTCLSLLLSGRAPDQGETFQ